MNTSKQQLKQPKKANRKQQERQIEGLTEREIKDLMGIDRPIYKRHRGAFRQR